LDILGKNISAFFFLLFFNLQKAGGSGAPAG
jgi:hypothetical protein